MNPERFPPPKPSPWIKIRRHGRFGSRGHGYRPLEGQQEARRWVVIPVFTAIGILWIISQWDNISKTGDQYTRIFDSIHSAWDRYFWVLWFLGVGFGCLMLGIMALALFLWLVRAVARAIALGLSDARERKP